MKIEKGIPLPKIQGTGRPKGGGFSQGLIRQMEIGDSVGELSKGQCSNFQYQARKQGLELSSRREGETYRVWRTR